MFKNGMRRVHPGEMLREYYQKEMALSTAALAWKLDVCAQMPGEVLAERRGISADMAERLSTHLGTTKAFWLNLQNAYDSSAP
jgi:addiction module HigA family antidote